MKYQYDYAVIGGDMRQVYLAEELAHHTNRVCCYGLCAPPDQRRCLDTSFIAAENSLKKICNAASCIICPTPFIRNGNFLNQSVFDEAVSIDLLLSELKPDQLLFAGCIPEKYKAEMTKKGVRVFDLMSNPSLSRFNSIAAAEGAVCEAIRESPLNLHKSSCAVLGYGKCGSTLAHYLKGMFCNLYVASEEEDQCAQAALIADRTGTLKDFETRVGDFDFIFNTIPAAVITSRLLSRMKSSITIIDIASAPGGVDFVSAEKQGIKALLCPGLPGKYAPSSSAKAVKEIIERILKEDETCL